MIEFHPKMDLQPWLKAKFCLEIIWKLLSSGSFKCLVVSKPESTSKFPYFDSIAHVLTWLRNRYVYNTLA